MRVKQPRSVLPRMTPGLGDSRLVVPPGGSTLGILGKRSQDSVEVEASISVVVRGVVALRCGPPACRTGSRRRPPSGPRRAEDRLRSFRAPRPGSGSETWSSQRTPPTPSLEYVKRPRCSTPCTHHTSVLTCIPSCADSAHRPRVSSLAADRTTPLCFCHGHQIEMATFSRPSSGSSLRSVLVYPLVRDTF